MQDGQNCGGSYLKLLSLSKETEDLTKVIDLKKKERKN